MALRAAERGDGRGAADAVADHHRLLPLEVREAEAAHRGDGVEEIVAEHAQAEGRSLPAGRGEAAEKRRLGGGLVEVEREGIEFAGEGGDHLLADRGAAERDHLANGEVFEMPAVRGDRVHRTALSARRRRWPPTAASH